MNLKTESSVIKQPAKRIKLLFIHQQAIVPSDLDSMKSFKNIEVKRLYEMGILRSSRVLIVFA